MLQFAESCSLDGHAELYLTHIVPVLNQWYRFCILNPYRKTFLNKRSFLNYPPESRARGGPEQRIKERRPKRPSYKTLLPSYVQSAHTKIRYVLVTCKKMVTCKKVVIRDSVLLQLYWLQIDIYFVLYVTHQRY